MIVNLTNINCPKQETIKLLFGCSKSSKSKSKNFKDCCLNQDLLKCNNCSAYILKETNFVPEIVGRCKS